jgi:DedD protein
MGLLSKLKSSPGGANDTRAGATTDANEVVRDARARARRRLIGAALLLGVGIIGFPLLFETQPRPIAVDIPIEIPPRDGVAPLQSPASRPARSAPAALPKPPVESAAPTTTGPASMAGALEPAPRAEATAAPKPADVRVVDAKPAEARPPKPPEPKPEAKPEPKPPEAKPVAKPAEPAKSTTDDEGRFVVQIGAFAEAASAREARLKVEGLGLKTYTQVIESDTGRRIRVRIGPYGTKAEADKAAARVKAAGLPSAVLKL